MEEEQSLCYDYFQYCDISAKSAEQAVILLLAATSYCKVIFYRENREGTTIHGNKSH